MKKVPPSQKPVSRRNLARDVVTALRADIISGKFRPGDSLAEPVLAERFGVSRAPIREALIELEREGLVQFEATGRTRVSPLTAEDLSEIVDARIAIEAMGARRAAGAWTAADSAWIAKNIAAQAKASTVAALTALDVEMHEYIMRRSGNERLIGLWRCIRPQFEMWLAHTHRLQATLECEPRNVTVDSHRRLLRAIESGDCEKAASAVSAHIAGWHEWLPSTFPLKTERGKRRISKAGSLFRVAGIFTLFAGSLAASAYADAGTEHFESKVRPLLVKHCYECHGAEKSKGGLALDTKAGWKKGGDSGPAIVPGRPDESLLIKAVRYEDKDLAMPPQKKGGKLPDSDIAALTEWVKMGAPDPREAVAKLGGMKADEAKSWWAFQPLKVASALAEEPSLELKLKPHSIDDFINAKLADEDCAAHRLPDHHRAHAGALLHQRSLLPRPSGCLGQETHLTAQRRHPHHRSLAHPFPEKAHRRRNTAHEVLPRQLPRRTRRQMGRAGACAHGQQ